MPSARPSRRMTPRRSSITSFEITASLGKSADPHGRAALVALKPQRRVARVVSRVDLNQRTDLAIVTEFDGGHIQEHAAKVHKRPAPQADVVAVVAMERRTHYRSLAGGTEQL